MHVSGEDAVIFQPSFSAVCSAYAIAAVSDARRPTAGPSVLSMAGLCIRCGLRNGLTFISASAKRVKTMTASLIVVCTESHIIQLFEKYIFILGKALNAAGSETLKGAGPYTVFAPTDAAFKKLPAGKLTNG